VLEDTTENVSPLGRVGPCPGFRYRRNGGASPTNLRLLSSSPPTPFEAVAVEPMRRLMTATARRLHDLSKHRRTCSMEAITRALRPGRAVGHETRRRAELRRTPPARSLPPKPERLSRSSPRAVPVRSPSPIWRYFAKRKNIVICRHFVSGRQDLNLRPPGPQPERAGAGQYPQCVSAGLLVSECCSVSLSLIPVLIPVRCRGCRLARHSRRCWTNCNGVR
jgi:hypothetical protein